MPHCTVIIEQKFGFDSVSHDKQDMLATWKDTSVVLFLIKSFQLWSGVKPIHILFAKMPDSDTRRGSCAEDLAKADLAKCSPGQ